MGALAMTILIGDLVMLIVIFAFVLTVKSGQYDDMEGPAHRILMDEDDPRIPGNSPMPESELASDSENDQK